MIKKLTDKEEAFCQAYVNDAETRWNKTQSAIKAGYSEKSARQIVTDTYAKPCVKARIDELSLEQREGNSELVTKIVERLKWFAGLSEEEPEYNEEPEDGEKEQPKPRAIIENRDAIQALKCLSSYAGMDKLDLTSKGEALPSTIIFKGVKADNE